MSISIIIIKILKPSWFKSYAFASKENVDIYQAHQACAGSLILGADSNEKFTGAGPSEGFERWGG